MTIVDLWGVVSTELRTNAAIAAIVGTRVRSEWAQGDTAPIVLLVQLGNNFSPMGQTRRTRIQAPLFAARCYGNTRPQASQLANAVVEAVELRGPRRDASNRLVYLSLVEGGGDAEIDPGTKLPYVTVTFTFIGSQRAVA